MCGRFVIEHPAEVLAGYFGLPAVAAFAPSYNVAPSRAVPVVRAASGERRLDWLRWGLVPHWAKDARSGLINARSETAAEKPSFRQAFRQRRCLVAASGFYEWQKTGEGKVPHYIRMADGAPMPMAGLWETWRADDGQVVETCAILTTSANAALALIHERMPVILPPDAFSLWLEIEEGDDLAALQALLAPCPDAWLVSRPVSRRVNRTANDDPQCIAAVAP